PELMARNIAIKAKVVVEDERETTGTRALLNFGHTIGHAIEAAAGYGVFLHGEAISLGLIAAARLSCQHSGLPEDERDQIISLLKKFQLPTHLPDTIPDEPILSYLARDKKFEEGQIRFVLLRQLGDAYVSDAINLQEIKNAIAELRG
ncbi:MAG: 3-dehydroquinate synthase family protein, partial [Verrucomicrobiales bacterium]